jgi:hypothetical protein
MDLGRLAAALEVTGHSGLTLGHRFKKKKLVNKICSWDIYLSIEAFKKIAHKKKILMEKIGSKGK